MTQPQADDNGAYKARALPFIPPALRVQRRSDGCILLWQDIALCPMEQSLAHLLARRAHEIPDRVLIAQETGGVWQTLSYGAMLDRARRIAAMLTDMGLQRGDRLLVLTGESIDHLALGFGAMFAGIVIVPISVGYAAAADTSRLQHVLDLVQPRLAFAEHADTCGAALAMVRDSGVPALHGGDGYDHLGGRESRALPVDLDHALARIDYATPYKVLMTSGSSSLPKGVVQTHGMSCASLAFEASLTTGGPGLRPESVVLDGLPWSHVGGSITVLNNCLLNGASLYLDRGRPVPGRFETTLRNLERFPQEHFATTPAGYGMLVDAMDRDPAFRQRFFSRLLTVKTGAAAMPEQVSARFQAHAVAETGHSYPLLIGYGSTEMHGVISLTRADHRAAAIGLPKPGVVVKLVPERDVFEIRIKSPSLTPGYVGDPAASAAAIDEEGFFRTGDGATFAEERGTESILYAGRIGENFKLATGTWVVASDLRVRLLAALDGAVSDCLVVGEGQHELGVILWPVAGQSPCLSTVRTALEGYNASTSGSARKIARAIVSAHPISAERFERTEKGSVNRNLVLANRANEVKKLFALEPQGCLILLDANLNAA